MTSLTQCLSVAAPLAFGRSDASATRCPATCVDESQLEASLKTNSKFDASCPEIVQRNVARLS